MRTASDFGDVLRAQKQAVRIEEPAMVVGLPVGLDPSQRDTIIWRDEGGIAAKGGLAIFDLRMAEIIKFGEG